MYARPFTFADADDARGDFGMSEETHLEMLKRRRRRREVHAHREDGEKEHRGEERWPGLAMSLKRKKSNSKLFF